jgi:hypothetical protein
MEGRSKVAAKVRGPAVPVFNIQLSTPLWSVKKRFPIVRAPSSVTVALAGAFASTPK